MKKSKSSKSASKRDDRELQQLGERLIALSVEELERIGLDDALRRAVLDAHDIKAHGALRRQKQYIGKLMRHADAEPIREALHRLGTEDRRHKALFRQAERWRDRIAIEGYGAVAALADLTGQRNPVLADLVGELSACQHEAGQRQILRRIFREVRRELGSNVQSDAC